LGVAAAEATVKAFATAVVSTEQRRCHMPALLAAGWSAAQMRVVDNSASVRLAWAAA
jgi:hypothetical protein